MRTTHSFGRPHGRSLRPAAALLALAAAIPAHAADPPTRRAARALDRIAAERAQAAERIEVSWLDAASGDWFDAARWTGGVAPNNDSALRFDARIDATGAPYTVVLSDDAVVSTLTLDAADATLIPLSGKLHVIETLSINAGSMRVGGVVSAGSLDLTGGDVTLAGGVVELGSTLVTSGGQFRFRNGTIRNTVIDGADAGFILDGDQSKTFESSAITGGVIDIGFGQTLRLRDDFTTLNGGGLHINRGTLELDGDFTLTADMNITFEDFVGGLVRVVSGADVTLDTGFAANAFRRVLDIEAGGTLTNRVTLEQVIFRPTSAGHFVNEGVIRASAIEGLWTNRGVMEGVTLENGAAGENFGVIRGVEIRQGEWVNHGLIELGPPAGVPFGVNGPLGGSGVNRGVVRVPEGRTGVIIGDWTNEGTIDARNAALTIARDLDPAFFESVLATGGVVTLAGDWDNSGQSYTFPADNGQWILDARVTGGAMRFTDDVLIRGPSFNDITLSGATMTTPQAGTITRRIHLLEGTVIDGLSIEAAGRREIFVAGDAALNDINLRLTESNNLTPELLLENARDHTLAAGGAITGTGTIGEWARTGGGDARLFNNGLIETDGGRLDIALFEVFNEGTIRASDGRIDFNVATLRNHGVVTADGGVIAIAPALFDSSGVFENHAVVTAESGGAIFLQNVLVNTGRIEVRQNSTFSHSPVGAPREFVNDGEIYGEQSARLFLAGVVNNGSIGLDGGEINVQSLVNNGALTIHDGLLRTTNSVSTTITNAGATTLGASAAIDILDTIRFDGAGSLRIEFDQESLTRFAPFINVNDAILGGALEIALADAAAFEESGRVTLINARETLQGDFADILLPASGDGVLFDLERTAHRLDLVVTVPAPASGAPLALAVVAITRRRRA